MSNQIFAHHKGQRVLGQVLLVIHAAYTVAEQWRRDDMTWHHAANVEKAQNLRLVIARNITRMRRSAMRGVRS